MKLRYFYTAVLIIIALGATSCGKMTPSEQVEYFEEADIDNGPICECEEDVYHLRYIYNSPSVI